MKKKPSHRHAEADTSLSIPASENDNEDEEDSSLEGEVPSIDDEIIQSAQM